MNCLYCWKSGKKSEIQWKFFPGGHPKAYFIEEVFYNFCPVILPVALKKKNDDDDEDDKMKNGDDKNRVHTGAIWSKSIKEVTKE